MSTYTKVDLSVLQRHDIDAIDVCHRARSLGGLRCFDECPSRWLLEAGM
jgi:hypothetical protein